MIDHPGIVILGREIETGTVKVGLEEVASITVIVTGGGLEAAVLIGVSNVSASEIANAIYIGDEALMNEKGGVRVGYIMSASFPGWVRAVCPCLADPARRT